MVTNELLLRYLALENLNLATQLLDLSLRLLVRHITLFEIHVQLSLLFEHFLLLLNQTVNFLLPEINIACQTHTI